MPFRRRKKRPSDRPRRAPAETPPREELRRASKAQLGPDEEARRYRPRADDASVEDPLGDWPEDC